MPEPFLKIQNLKTYFPVEKGLFFRHKTGDVKAVDGVSLELQKGEVLGLVGESGCGKSTLGRTVLRLIEPTSGCVYLGPVNLQSLQGDALRKARKDFQMIFQDPYASLNPRMTVYDALAEAIVTHEKIQGRHLEEEIRILMHKVGLSPKFIHKYPHEFSGGQRQRIAIARALAVKPKLIIADEPVSALDVSIQAQIINLLARLSKEMELTMIFISHDLSVVHHISDRIAVMYLGKIVEEGPADIVFQSPRHPYTQALVSAVPLPDPELEAARRRIILQGDPPSPLNPPSGCPFHPRCIHAVESCALTLPLLEKVDDHHTVACLRVDEIQSTNQPQSE